MTLSPPSKILSLACAAGMAAAFGNSRAIAETQASTDAADLRTYGKVAADLQPARSVFECESVEKADILLDKLQTDLFWDDSLPVRKADYTMGKNTVTVYSLDGGYGAAVIARAGKKVVVLGAASRDEAARLADKEPLLQGDDVTSKAVKPHPMSLDYFDNRAFKAYVPPMRAMGGFTLESHWPFLKSLGAASASFGPMLHNVSPASGVVDWTAHDYEVREAERQHDMVVLGPNGGGEMPLWVANADPDSMMKASDTTLLGDWGGAGMVGAHYEAWQTPFEERSQTALGFLRQAIERYGSSPSLGGWMLFAGSPGFEYNFHGRSTHAWDTSPTSQAGWRDWLQNEKHLSLADLGTRWHGDPKRFSSWTQVRVPDLNEFYGELGADSFRLNAGWKWQNLPAKDPATGAPVAQMPPPPAAKATGWVPFAMPPSQRLAFMSRTGFNYYDITFNPSDWLQKQKKGSDVWLVFALIGTGGNAVQAWLNGKPLEMPTDSQSRDSSFSIRLTGLLKPGSNHLQVGIKCASYQTAAGKPAGPVFLTTHEPKRFPYLGPGGNARFADFTEWQCWAMTDYHRKMLAMARKLDPDRPFVLSGAAEPLTGYGMKMATDYGMGIENTGREASYRPHLPGLGLGAGFYSTSEWSGTPEGEWLDRGFGWILFDGDSSHCLYHDIDAFQKREQEDQWFTRHRRQIQLFGKYLRVQPGVALLQSVDTAQFPSTGGWDIGVGAIQSAHYDNVYLTEQGLKDGLAGQYPILFDTGSEYMEPETVDAIRKYVEQGGTFVALDNTARHTLLEPDSNPLASVSGFKFLKAHGGGNIHFASELPIFKGWEDRPLRSWGTSLEPTDPADPSAVPLALWDDGTVAVGYRKVGKGQVITLGGTFWHEGNSDEFLREFLEKLFTECGISRDASASIPEVWTRKMVTKNGLQNWLISFNSTPNTQDADVWMATGAKPDEVISLETNTKVPFVFENNGVTIKGVHLEPNEIKAFAVRRGTLTDGLPVWWKEKTTYWKRTPVQLAAAAETLPEPKRKDAEFIVPLEKWRFHTDPDQALLKDGQWMTAAFDDSGWQTREAGAWTLFDPELKNYHGIGLYRIKFTAPPSWVGRRILLNLYNFDTPIVYDLGEFFLNGKPVATYKAHGWSQTLNYDVTPVIQPGENILTLKVTGGAKLAGFGGVAWIEARPALNPSIDLAGTWTAVRANWLGHGPVTIPGTATAKYIARTIIIPADWSGKNIFIEWASRDQWVGSVVVNGRPTNNNAAIHPFGTLARVNITPHVRTGASNLIEIWPYRTVTWHGGVDKEETGGLQLDGIRIGCQ